VSIILGIDPGLTRCGVGLVKVDARRKCELVHVEVITSGPTQELTDRIGLLGKRLEEVIREFKPDVIALERVFAQANLRTVMGTAQISGVVLHLASQYGLKVALHTPTEVKAAVSGSGRADKKQVGTMVAKILNLSEIPKPADAADALAIAITQGWRGAVSNTSTGNLTPAQQAWALAERAAKEKSPR